MIIYISRISSVRSSSVLSFFPCLSPLLSHSLISWWWSSLGGFDNICKWGILLHFKRNICFLWRKRQRPPGKLQSRGPLSLGSDKTIRANVNSKSQQTLKIRQNSYAVPTSHFSLVFVSLLLLNDPPFSPCFPSVARYTAVCVRLEQEMKQSSTSIHTQAPAFYWITSWQKKNRFIFETGNTSHSFISALHITRMLTPSLVSLQPRFFYPKVHTHQMWTWMNTKKMCSGGYTVLLIGRQTMSTEMTLDPGQWHWIQKTWLKGRRLVYWAMPRNV
jgi:hypothetical protein